MKKIFSKIFSKIFLFPDDTLEMANAGTLKTSNVYKTKMCRTWLSVGKCPYGDRCTFAHGSEELRPRVLPRYYRTAICDKYARDGWCPYGDDCTYIHSTKKAHFIQEIVGHHELKWFSHPIQGRSDVQFLPSCLTF